MKDGGQRCDDVVILQGIHFLCGRLTLKYCSWGLEF